MRQVDEGKDFALTRGDLAGAGSRHIRKKMRSNNELQEVSRGHSTRGEKKTEEGPNNRKSQVSERRRSIR